MPISQMQAANDNNRSAQRNELIESLLSVAQPLLRHGLSFRVLEERLLEITNEFLRRALKQALQGLSAGFGDEIVVVAAGAKQRYRRHHRGTVRSLVGPLDIKRWTRKIFTLRIVSRLHARRWIESHEGSVRKFGRSFRSSNRRFGRTRSSRRRRMP